MENEPAINSLKSDLFKKFEGLSSDLQNKFKKIEGHFEGVFEDMEALKALKDSPPKDIAEVNTRVTEYQTRFVNFSDLLREAKAMEDSQNNLVYALKQARMCIASGDAVDPETNSEFEKLGGFLKEANDMKDRLEGIIKKLASARTDIIHELAILCERYNMLKKAQRNAKIWSLIKWLGLIIVICAAAALAYGIMQ